MGGIPGAVGGGLRMNAGAMGAQTFENVVRVRYLDADGEAHTKSCDELEVCTTGIAYSWRKILQSPPFSAASVRQSKKSCAKWKPHRRNEALPFPAAKSAGCIFKNPDSCPAGKLVDEMGLKNSRVGKARVSEVHGNFIVNDGGATAAEMLELIEKIKETALAKRGIELETEAQIVGEPG